MLDDLQLERIHDPAARAVIQHLLNLIETLAAENRELRAANQRLRDENNRLKGEQGKPNIKPNTRPPASDHSSERDRQEPTPRGKRGNRHPITIDRTEDCRVDRTTMPPDARFKGYETLVVEDLRLQTDNVQFRREKWYAPSTRQTYLGPLPLGYDGAFGPHIKALAVTLVADCHMSQPQIRRLFANAGVLVSAGTLAAWVTHDLAPLHAEAEAVYEAGLRSSPWQQIDDTATRVGGQNQHCHIVCNPLYTAYHTTPHKDRLSVLAVVRNHRPPRYRLDALALALMECLGVAAIHRTRLASQVRDAPLDESTFQALLEEQVPQLPPQHCMRVHAAAAIAAYRAETDWPVIRHLLGDDAPQWALLTETVSGCWVHAGRHLAKLTPVVAAHRRLLKRFRARFWRLYRALRAYQQAPTRHQRTRLICRFDRLCATRTGYWALDDRIAKLGASKAVLLAVLDHPELPLHNNAAELGARQRVRKRDISFGPQTDAGAKAWDTLQTLAATARKLGVSVYHYLHDRFTKTYHMPALADLIIQRAQELPLGASWATA